MTPAALAAVIAARFARRPRAREREVDDLRSHRDRVAHAPCDNGGVAVGVGVEHPHRHDLRVPGNARPRCRCRRERRCSRDVCAVAVVVARAAVPAKSQPWTSSTPPLPSSSIPLPGISPGFVHKLCEIGVAEIDARVKHRDDHVAAGRATHAEATPIGRSPWRAQAVHEPGIPGVADRAGSGLGREGASASRMRCGRGAGPRRRLREAAECLLDDTRRAVLAGCRTDRATARTSKARRGSRGRLVGPISPRVGMAVARYMDTVQEHVRTTSQFLQFPHRSEVTRT